MLGRQKTLLNGKLDWWLVALYWARTSPLIHRHFQCGLPVKGTLTDSDQV